MTDRWPLPERPYIPGQTPRPSASPAFEAAAAAPDRTDPQAWAANETYNFGASLYRAGFFWEAHEVWEPVWMNARPNSRERALMQGLIQLANACLKLRMGRDRAANRLLDEATRHLAQIGPETLMGLEPAVLSAEVNQFRDSEAKNIDLRPQINPNSAL